MATETVGEQIQKLEEMADTMIEGMPESEDIAKIEELRNALADGLGTGDFSIEDPIQDALNLLRDDLSFELGVDETGAIINPNAPEPNTQTIDETPTDQTLTSEEPVLESTDPALVAAANEPVTPSEPEYEFQSERGQQVEDNLPNQDAPEQVDLAEQSESVRTSMAEQMAALRQESAAIETAQEEAAQSAYDDKLEELMEAGPSSEQLEQRESASLTPGPGDDNLRFSLESRERTEAAIEAYNDGAADYAKENGQELVIEERDINDYPRHADHPDAREQFDQSLDNIREEIGKEDQDLKELYDRREDAGQEAFNEAKSAEMERFNDPERRTPEEQQQFEDIANYDYDMMSGMGTSVEELRQNDLDQLLNSAEANAIEMGEAARDDKITEVAEAQDVELDDSLISQAGDWVRETLGYDKKHGEFEDKEPEAGSETGVEADASQNMSVEPELEADASQDMSVDPKLEADASQNMTTDPELEANADALEAAGAPDSQSVDEKFAITDDYVEKVHEMVGGEDGNFSRDEVVELIEEAQEKVYAERDESGVVVEGGENAQSWAEEYADIKTPEEMTANVIVNGSQATIDALNAETAIRGEGLTDKAQERLDDVGLDVAGDRANDLDALKAALAGNEAAVAGLADGGVATAEVSDAGAELSDVPDARAPEDIAAAMEGGRGE